MTATEVGFEIFCSLTTRPVRLADLCLDKAILRYADKPLGNAYSVLKLLDPFRRAGLREGHVHNSYVAKFLNDRIAAGEFIDEFPAGVFVWIDPDHLEEAMNVGQDYWDQFHGKDVEPQFINQQGKNPFGRTIPPKF